MAVRTAGRNRGEWRPAATLPVARVAVEIALAHLDRPFDYAVPEHLDAAAGIGVRVRVRFAGRLVDGFVLERVAASEHPGRLAWLEKVVSTEQALPPEIAALCRAVADRCSGVLADVLRLAVPPRHARVEAEVARAASRSDAERPAGPAGAAGHADAPGDQHSAGMRDGNAVTAEVGHGDQRSAGEGDGDAFAIGVGQRDQRSADVGDSSTAGADVGRADQRSAGVVDGGMGAVGTAHRDQHASGEGGPAGVDVRGWRRYARGPAFLRALGEGRAAHAVWQALPGEAWADRLADAAQATAHAGRGALLVVPDQRDVDVLRAACAARLGAEAVVSLTADLGPAERYRRWLAVRHGQVRVVVGTRSAAFAPVVAPGLLAIWDDGDDLHAEPRAPYPHVRDVLVLRAHAVGAALLVGGHARTAEGQLLVESGWAREIVADRAMVRAAMPRIVAQGESDIQLARDPLARAARLPSAAFEAARAALAAGRPVLVQTPRAGYVPWLSCAACRETARCRRCAGPLGLPGRPAGAAGTADSTEHPTDRPGDRGPDHLTDRATGGHSGGWPVDRATREHSGGWPVDRATREHSGGWPVGADHLTDRATREHTGGRPARYGAEPIADRAVAGYRADRGAERPAGPAAPSCRWCGRVESAYRCGACGSRRLRAGVVGSRRTAEELGRAFPGVPVRISGGGAPVLDSVATRPEIVVATPGAEPRAEYGAALLLDGWALLARPDLRVAEETLRRWMAAAAMVVSHTEGGRVLVMADPGLPPVQALVRWDPAGHAAAELAARAEVGFPPAVRMAAIDAGPAALKDILDDLTAGLPTVDVLGPVELDPAPDGRDPRGDGEARERALVRVPRAHGRELAAALHVAQAARTARKATDPVRVQMDPPDIG